MNSSITHPQSNSSYRLGAILSMFFGAASVVQATTSTHLLVDPGFEFQSTLPGYGAVVSNFSNNQGTWGSEAGLLTGQVGGVSPINSTMLAMFASGITSQSVQVTNLAPFAAGIANGNATFELSSFFNVATRNSGAIANLSVRFYDIPNFGSSIGQINGISLILDGNEASWEKISLIGTIPANALWMTSEVLFNSASLNGDAGFVDNSVDGSGLSITTVPEPSSALLGALGCMAVIFRRRR